MKRFGNILFWLSHVMITSIEPTFEGNDHTICDCNLYKTKISFGDDFKLTRIYSTSTRPSRQTTTSQTTYVTRPETVTPIYLSKVSSLILPASSTMTAHPMSKNSRRFASSTVSTSRRSTTSSTTPSTSFGSSSTTPSSYTVATFSSSSTSTPISSDAYTNVKKLLLMSSSRVTMTRMLSSSSSRPTKEYTTTTRKARITTTTVMKNLRSHRIKEKDKAQQPSKKEKLSAKCMEYCRSRTTSSKPTLSNGDSRNPYREYVIDEVPISIDLTMVVTADFSPELNNSASIMYKSVVTHLENLLVNIYNSTKGFQRVSIRKLRQGSIICEYTISLILKGNSSVSENILQSLHKVKWQQTVLPISIGTVDKPSTQKIQGRQLKIVAQRFKDICSLIGRICIKQGRICINSKQKGQAICVLPCSGSQRQELGVTCLHGTCFLDDAGKPKCFCESENTCVKKISTCALYVLSAIAIGMVMLLFLLIGLTGYLYSKRRLKPRCQKQQDRKDIKIRVIEELVATNFHARKH